MANTTKIQTGAIKRINTLSSLITIFGVPSSCSAKIFWSRNQPANKPIRIPPIGKITLLDTKSIVSKKLLPGKSVRSDHTLNEKALPSPSSQARPPTIIAPVTRETFTFSTSHATAGSPIDIADVMAAKETRRKNSVPNI